MRNLALVSNSVITLENLNLSATTVDLDENVLYAISETQNLDGKVAIEIWKIGSFKTGGLIQVRNHFKQYISLMIFKGAFASDNVLGNCITFKFQICSII